MKASFEFSDRVIGIVLEEKMDEHVLKKIQEIVEQRLEDYSEVSLYLEDRYSNGLTLKAFLKDLWYELSNTEPLFKVAVVTDKKRFQIITALKDKLLFTNVQYFERHERVAAMNWVME